MPFVNPPSRQWFANQLAQMKQDIQALKAAQTTYVTDASGAAQAIIGNIATDPEGNATGLSGFGIAVLLSDGEWAKLGPRAVRGGVTSTGGVGFGSGFTAARTPGGSATGDYTVTFATPFAAQPAITVAEVGDPSNFTLARIVSQGASSFRVTTVITTTSAFEDSAFNFFAEEA